MSFSAFKKFLKESAADPEDTRRRKLLNVTLAGVSLMALLADLYVGWYFWTQAGRLTEKAAADIGRIALVSFAILGGAAVFYLINRFVSGLLAGFLFIAFLLGALPFSDSPAQLTAGRSTYIFAVPIVMAGALLPSWAVFVFALLSCAVVILLAYETGGEFSILALLAFLFIAFLSWLSTRSLEQSLRETRRINENLDQLAREKTEELAQTLRREIILAGRNQAILDSIADGVIVFDENGDVILANPALSRMTGIPLETLNRISATDFAEHPGLSLLGRETLLRAVAKPEKFHEGARLTWGEKTLSLSAAHTPNYGVAVLFRDVTQEAAVEKMKETFVAIVSHELRTPLNAIMGYAEMLKEAFYGPLAEKQSAALDRIMVNVHRMFLMVGDLLDEAQLKAGKLSIKSEPFRLEDWINGLRSALKKSAADKGINLVIETDADMPEILTGDSQRLHQIVVNLAGNAIKFTERGEVRVSISRDGESKWLIQVRDTGAGIPAAELPHIFEPFRQAEEPTRRIHGGFGLGLAIVKQLTELMQGAIGVESEPGKGSAFSVSLPLNLKKQEKGQP